MQKFNNVITSETNAYFIVPKVLFEEVATKSEGPKLTFYISDEVFNIVKNVTDLFWSEFKHADSDQKLAYRAKVVELLKTIKQFDEYEIKNSLDALGY